MSTAIMNNIDTTYPFVSIEAIKNTSESIENVIDIIFVKPQKSKKEKIRNKTYMILRRECCTEAFEEVFSWSNKEMKRFLALCNNIMQTVHSCAHIEVLDDFSQQKYLICREFLYCYYPDRELRAMINEGARDALYSSYTKMLNNEDGVRLRSGVEVRPTIKEYMDRESQKSKNAIDKQLF